jgi:ribosomal-protein-serine acetyltransferase
LTLKINDKISLELTAMHHAAALYAVVNNNRAHLGEFLPWVPYMQSVTDFEQYITNCEKLYQQQQEISFVIMYGGELVGRIGIHYINQQNKCGAIGYWLTKDAEGKGIVTQACITISNYGFEKLQLQRIELKAATLNHRSLAIPQRLGFVQEGVLRKAEKVNNLFLNIALFSLLKEDWECNPLYH